MQLPTCNICCRRRTHRVIVSCLPLLMRCCPLALNCVLGQAKSTPRPPKAERLWYAAGGKVGGNCSTNWGTGNWELGNLAPCRVVAYLENLCGQLVDAVLARLGHLGALQVANVRNCCSRCCFCCCGRCCCIIDKCLQIIMLHTQQQATQTRIVW